jgi:hypothetical protein
MRQRAEKLLRRLEAEALLNSKTPTQLRTLRVELDRSDSIDKFRYIAYANNFRIHSFIGYIPRSVALDRLVSYEKNALYKIE